VVHPDCGKLAGLGRRLDRVPMDPDTETLKLKWTMKTIEYRDIVDRSGWDRGPWDGEPDKVQWQDPTGMPCLAVRNQAMGNWCGYVGVTQDHPFFGLDYHDEKVDVEVHGGLTFCGACSENDKEDGICHRPDPGEPDHVWWLGFDCGHAFDLSPGLVATLKSYGTDMGKFPGDVYRDLAYVKRECAELAKQLRLANESET
jgi:hypothetical protein